MEEFIKNFANQFDETDPSEINASTTFHELDEWSSLVGLAILNMVAKKYGVKLSPAELKSSVTVTDVYNLVQSKLV